MSLMEFKNKKELSLTDNKKMKINKIYGIDIDYFRKFKNQTLDLGRNMTVIFGRNGTLKSTLMGLIAQPFRTEFTNIFGQKMETDFSEVFNMSTKYDNTTYKYSIRMNIDDDLLLKEPIPLYPEKYPKGNPKAGETYRFRLVPSGRAKGDGYFNLSSVYIKLDRVYPLIDSVLKDDLVLTKPLEESDNLDIGKFYERVLLRTDFNKSHLFEAEHGQKNHYPYEPVDSYYDKKTISSGENNLSSFINTMISFQKVYRALNDPNRLTGIWNIDEFETSLHPVAQVNLFDYLCRWSRKYNVQIVLNTHSLYLIQYILSCKHMIDSGDLVINEIASRFNDKNTLSIIKNPSYKSAYEELTLSKTANLIEENTKVKIFCEDKVAESYIKAILPTKIKKYLSWYPNAKNDLDGTDFKLLNNLCKNYPIILENENAIVINDADEENSINLSGSNYKKHYAIPSLYSLPLEKELVYWILSLDGSDQFFTSVSISQDEFKAIFARFDLPLSVDRISSAKTKLFKNWYKNNVRENNKYRTQYIRRNLSIFTEFKNTIINDVKEIMLKNGIKIDLSF